MVIKQAITISLTILILFGCSYSVPKKSTPAPMPTLPAADLVFVDKRPEILDQYGMMLPLVAVAMPGIPYSPIHHKYLLDRSFLPRMRKTLEETRLFENITGPGSSVQARQNAPIEIHITLLETRNSEYFVTYGLGETILVPFLLGVPTLKKTTAVRLQIDCIKREQGVIASELGESETILWVNNIYYPSESNFLKTLDNAVLDAVNRIKKHLQ